MICRKAIKLRTDAVHVVCPAVLAALGLALSWY
jgi:hypothetical protein